MTTYRSRAKQGEAPQKPDRGAAGGKPGQQSGQKTGQKPGRKTGGKPGPRPDPALQAPPPEKRLTDWERGRIGAPGVSIRRGRASGALGPAFAGDAEQDPEIARARTRAREAADNRWRADRKRAGFAMSLTAFAMGVPPDDLLHPSRLSGAAAFARQAAMYLCHVVFGMSLARVAAAFRRDRSTVAHACHRMEDQRDDHRFDAWMERLESSARQAHVDLAGDLP